MRKSVRGPPPSKPWLKSFCWSSSYWSTLTTKYCTPESHTESQTWPQIIQHYWEEIWWKDFCEWNAAGDAGESRHIQEASAPPTRWFSIYSDERVKDRRSIQIKCKILHKPCSDKHVGTFTLCTCRSRIYMEWGGKSLRFLSAADDAAASDVCDVSLILLLHFPEDFPQY